MKLFVRVLAGFTLFSVILFLLTICQFLLFTSDSFGISANEYRNFEKSIIDYRQRLNPVFKKIKRNSTRYIIVHTSECDLKTTLKIVSQGKQDNYKWVSRGGHTHYVIARSHVSALELKVAKSDMGKVIGKRGRTARAIRAILSADSGKTRKKVYA